MPAYNASPFAASPAPLIPGSTPVYLFGSWPSYIAPTRLAVSSVAVASNVCTLGVTVTEGNIPAVGSLISVSGTATSSGAANVTNVALTAVSITATTGIGTVSYALTASNVSTTSDGGVAFVPQPEVGDTVANGASVAAALPYTTPFSSNSGSQQIQCEVTFPTVPTACVVALQGAAKNNDSEFQTIISNVVTVSTGTATYGTLQISGKWNFVRFLISGTSGSGKIVAKVNI